jgi:hypothetical protein
MVGQDQKTEDDFIREAMHGLPYASRHRHHA